MTTQNMITWTQDADGIVTLTMDDPNQSANTLNDTYVTSMNATVERLVAEQDNITGVVLTSAKKTFFAGGDLNDLMAAGPEDAQRLYDMANEIKAALRTLETFGRPVVAALNGAALGGGLEIALSTHHRIAADVPSSRIGLPEVTLGLLPGGGGLVRTVRMFGVTEALQKILGQGQRYRPAQALEVGLVDEVVVPADLIQASKNWIKAHPEVQQPWDTPGYKIPGGTPTEGALADTLPLLPATLRKQLKGANYPAPRAILAAAVESTQVDFENAQLIESRHLVELATGQVSTNMIKAFFFDMQHITSGGSRPEGFEKYTPLKAGVLGAGMMGAAIAYVCAKAGIEVVLKDVTVENAERGKGYSKDILDRSLAKGRTTQHEADALLVAITPTADPNDLAGCDLIIEAVFEDVDLKHRVFQEIEDLVPEGTLLGSNTSSLPITELAEGVKKPEDFIGLHFFSPVEKMPLLEIVVGEKTSDETLAKAFDVAQRIGKTPIVVNDSRGFFTTRVISAFLNEAQAMVAEGISAASVEQAGLQAGYPAPPLQLTDELTFGTMSRIQKATKAGYEAEGRADEYFDHPGYAVIDRMIEEFDRNGKSSGQGFYDYTDGQRTGLWPGLAEHFGSGTHKIPLRDMIERMLFAEAIETVKCFDEGVLRSVADANVGSLLGIGFPGWTGGVVQYINGYKGGPAGFVARAKELADAYGPQFTPPGSLVAVAQIGGTYPAHINADQTQLSPNTEPARR
jgi:3-hydroxyacyl-CoA dehydrogenase/enoyl-CoA hydratase/3-hydroxybutyryl-CoA epimerase